MRILIAQEALVGAGGIESYLASVIPALLARGHSVAFLHLSPRAAQGPLRLGHPDVPSAGVSDEGLEPCMAWVRRFRPDVCFSHNISKLEVDERLTREWPTVKMMHGYFGTCVSSQKAHAFPAIKPCSRTFGAGCLALYLPRYCGQLRPARMLRQFRWAGAQHALLARYAHVVVASRHMATEFERHGVPPSNLTVAPLFPALVDSDGPRPLPREHTVLFAGRMTPLKGADVLLRAVAVARTRLRMPVRVVLAGAGPEAGRLKVLASALGVSTTFAGWVTGADREALFRGASLLAMPSLWPEPFGLAGLEAAAHGVPAVAFDVGGIREWLRDGIGGRFAAPAGSAEALGLLLAEILNDPEQLGRLSRGAREVATQLSLEAHLSIVEPILRRVSHAPAVTV